MQEKNSFLNYNVSCIMTLPPYQRKGFGRLLIDFSASYWKDLLLNYLSSYSDPNISIKDMSAEMAVNSYDIVSTFQYMGMMKYWKGKHILLKRQDLLEEFVARRKKRRQDHAEIDDRYLNWRPYVVTPDDATQSNSNNGSGGGGGSGGGSGGGGGAAGPGNGKASSTNTKDRKKKSSAPE
ncbi:hypothetical protein HAZT_HAZT001424 [Hyalella azteca]|uniref:Histone acetyltransferase n=1 Tax=Hyalella azteca TaxID=294128 RepID=A0A6A0HCI7_HYAAZ|nr:hypothetical protein HAZT_HAZT001424 [Hyalella azteca]